MLKKILNRATKIFDKRNFSSFWNDFFVINRAQSITEHARILCDLNVLINMPSGFRCSNASIYLVEGVYFVLARGINYGFGKFNSLYFYTENKKFNSVNFLLKFNREFVLLSCHQLDDIGARAVAETDLGLEDGRLFEESGLLRVLFAGADSAGGDGVTDPNSKIVVCTIQGNNEIKYLRTLSSPYGLSREKNWMPSSDGTAIIYKIDEFVELYDPQSGGVRRADNLCELGQSVSGSSILIRWKDGWIAVGHRTIRKFKNLSAGMFPNYYIHFFLFFDDTFCLKNISDPFYFERKGTEFCIGLAKGDDFYLSYSVAEHDSRILAISEAHVQSLFNNEIL